MIARRIGIPGLLVLTVFLVHSPDSSGMFVPKDFREMVQETDRVIKGKVLRGADVNEPERHVALLQVLEHFQPGEEERLKVYIEDTTANPSGYSYKEGEVCFLCLQKWGTKPGIFQEVNYGHTKIAVKDDRVSLEEVKVPDSLKFLLPDRRVATFENALRWVRGPEITVKAVAETVRCDEDILFDVTLRNGSRTPMKVEIGKGLALGCHFDLTLLGKHGFYSVCRIYGGYDRGRQYFPNGEKHFVTELLPGLSVKGRIRFKVPLDRFSQDPANTKLGWLDFRPRQYGTFQSGQWTGETSVTVPLTITCPYREWAQTLMRPNPTTSIGLETQEVLSPDRNLWVNVTVNRGKAGKSYGCYSGYSFEGEQGKRTKAELARCFEITRGGEVVQKSDGDREIMTDFLESVRNVSFDIDLSRHFDFSRPGEYGLRLYLPDTEGFSLSRQVRILVPRKK